MNLLKWIKAKLCKPQPQPQLQKQVNPLNRKVEPEFKVSASELIPEGGEPTWGVAERLLDISPEILGVIEQLETAARPDYQMSDYLRQSIYHIKELITGYLVVKLKEQTSHQSKTDQRYRADMETDMSGFPRNFKAWLDKYDFKKFSMWLAPSIQEELRQEGIEHVFLEVRESSRVSCTYYNNDGNITTMVIPDLNKL